MRVLVVLVVLAGCDTVFGLTDLKPPADAAPDAVDPLHVVGRYHVLHTVNQGDFTPKLVDEPYPPEMMTLSVRLDDGSTPAVTYTADGAFSFPLATAGQSYRLTAADPRQSIEVQAAANHLELGDRAAGRLSPAPVTMPTPIHFQLSTTSNVIYVSSTGVWTQTYAGTNTGTFDFDWQQARASIDHGLLDAALYDRLYVATMASYGAGPTAYGAVSSYGAYSVTLTDGQPTVISSPAIAMIMHDRCTHVLALRGEVYGRIHAAMPGFPTFGDGWSVLALPSYELESAGALLVAAGGEANPTPSDIDDTATYFNPFVGTDLAAAMDVIVQRPLQLPGTTTAVTITGGVRTLQKIPGMTCASRVIVQSTIGIAATPQLDGTPLATDNQAVTLAPAPDPVASWTLASPGPVDYAVVVLFEVVNSGGATALVARRGVLTAGTSATFDRALFASGHTYLVQITNVLGAPNAAAGDVTTITYPYEKMVTLSSSFKVN
jgi:hypothetical protein